jgi:hypothetical protein
MLPEQKELSNFLFEFVPMFDISIVHNPSRQIINVFRIEIGLTAGLKSTFNLYSNPDSKNK